MTHLDEFSPLGQSASVISAEAVSEDGKVAPANPRPPIVFVLDRIPRHESAVVLLAVCAASVSLLRSNHAVTLRGGLDTL